MKTNISESVIERVVDNGVCVGCGMCAGTRPDALEMHTNRYGEYQPKPSGNGLDWESASLDVCPFSGEGENEDLIGRSLFGEIEGIMHRPETGFFLRNYAAHISDEGKRLKSTSGGLITWLAQRLLITNEVDLVACVGPSERADRLFDYQLFDSPEQLEQCRKSRYYPVELSRIIPQIKASQKRVLFIGLPCFTKALNLAMRHDPELRACVTHTIGLVCGHLKTKKYTDYLARHVELPADNIKTVDFRKKVPGHSANKYAFEATGLLENDKEIKRQIMMSDVFASSWGNNLFMLEACECCDDIFSETADIVIGDAWLPEFTGDYRGESIVLARSQRMAALLDEGIAAGELLVRHLPIEKVIASQSGALNQRREGLQYRLALAQKKGRWQPSKRIPPNITAGTWLFRTLQNVRLQFTRLSKEAYEEQEKKGPGLEHFKQRMTSLTKQSQRINFLRYLPSYLRAGPKVALQRLRGKIGKLSS